MSMTKCRLAAILEVLVAGSHNFNFTLYLVDTNKTSYRNRITQHGN